MKAQIEKKIEEIKATFKEGEAQLEKANNERTEIYDFLKRLQGAYTILQEQLVYLEKKEVKVPKKKK